MHCPGSGLGQVIPLEEMDVSLHEIHLHLNASPSGIDQIKEKTAKDEVLFSPRSIITQGWPNTRSDGPAHLYAFWNYRDELTFADGLNLKGIRILRPKTLQAHVLQQLHYEH